MWILKQYIHIETFWCEPAMTSLPGEFEEPPIEFSEEAIRISSFFQDEPDLQKEPWLRRCLLQCLALCLLGGSLDVVATYNLIRLVWTYIFIYSSLGWPYPCYM